MRAIDDGGRSGSKEGRKEGAPAAADAAESCYYKTCTDIDISGGGLRFPHTEFHLKARKPKERIASLSIGRLACVRLSYSRFPFWQLIS